MDQALTDKAKGVRALVLDGDGVIFTGAVFEGLDGPLAKIRCHADGQGISLLRAQGVAVCCVTGESGEHARFLEQLVVKWNNLPSVAEGRWKPVSVFSGAERHRKVELVEKWLADNGLTLRDCAAMGDDLSDFNLLAAVREAGGVAAAPAQAEKVIKNIVQFVAERRGGDGAIRDLANMILEAKGVDVTASALR